MRARVFVTLKPSVFDPQGTTVTEALHTLGYGSVKDVRQGKYFELDIDARSADEARQLASEAADKLLANPVIESYRIEVTGMKFAVVVFPGSNCDHDAHYAAKHVLGQDAELIWHKDTSLKGADVVILPGGFAHGDYLRTGAIARFSPIMQEVEGFRRGRRTGARHLQRLSDPARGRTAARRDAAQPQPALPLRARPRQRSSRLTRRSPLRRSRDRSCAFRSRTVRATTTPSPRSSNGSKRNRQVVFRYVAPSGDGDDGRTRTASLHNIAGITNEARNVVGLMPHPERACELAVGSADGRVVFESVAQAVSSRRVGNFASARWTRR